jgi:hypothetical protein
MCAKVEKDTAAERLPLLACSTSRIGWLTLEFEIRPALPALR